MKQHRLSWSSFDLLAEGRIDDEAQQALRASQLSRHLILLRHVIDSAIGSNRRLPATVRSSVDVLAAAERADPAAYAQVIGYPYVGAWLRKAAADINRHIPADLDHLTRLAAAAAIRASIDFELVVPVAAGQLSIPGHGTAALSTGGRSTTVTVTHRDERTTIDQSPLGDGTTWVALPRLSWSHGRSAGVIDDRDLYRAVPGMAVSPPLDRQVAERWTGLYAEALDLLGTEAPLTDTVLTPLVRRGPHHGMSATSRQAFGAIYLTEPGTAVDLAVTVRHETQHGRLNALLDLVDLIEPDGRLYYSPWREDPRPLTGLLHGAYAFAGVAAFWHRHLAVGDNPRANYELTRTLTQVDRAVRAIDSSSALTAAGRRFVAGIARSCEALQAPSMSAAQRRYAAIAVDDHALRWRFRNVRSERESVRGAAAAWLAGSPSPTAPIPSTVASGSHPFAGDRREELLLKLAAGMPDRESADTLDPATDTVDAAIGAADALLTSGDSSAAADRYQAILADEPDSLAAWTGLALARQHTDDPDVADIWRHRPELVRAVCAEIAALRAAPSPSAVARWLAAPGIPGTDDSGGRRLDVAVEAPQGPR